MNTRSTRNKFERGMTIVELMVASAVGLILMAIALSIFFSNKQTAEVTEDLSRLQESGRFAIGQISRDLRMAGYWGCHDGGAEAVINTLNGATGGSAFNNVFSVEGLEQGAAAWQPSGGTEIRPTPVLLVTDVDNGPDSLVAGTDAVGIRYVSGSGFNLTTGMLAANDSLQVGAGAGFRDIDVLVISDCQTAHVFQITDQTADDAYDLGLLGHVIDATYTPGNATDTFTANSQPKVYGTDAVVARMVSTRYWVGNGTNGPALLRTRLSGSTLMTDEIAEGVDTLQITYGEDTDGDVSRSPDVYRDAATVANWDNVVSVRVGLLLRTVDEYGTDTDTRRYAVNGVLVCPAGDTDPSCVSFHAVDRRQRRVFGTTVLMRNLQ